MKIIINKEKLVYIYNSWTSAFTSFFNVGKTAVNHLQHQDKPNSLHIPRSCTSLQVRQYLQAERRLNLNYDGSSCARESKSSRLNAVKMKKRNRTNALRKATSRPSGWKEADREKGRAEFSCEFFLQPLLAFTLRSAARTKPEGRRDRDETGDASHSLAHGRNLPPTLSINI